MSTVYIDLDTRAPEVTVPDIRDIEPPAVWDARFEADEDLGPVTFVLADARGDEYLLGHVVEGRSIQVTVPTTTLLQGPAKLLAWIADTVCNVRQIEVPLHVLGVIGYEATLVMGRAYEVTMSMDQAYEALVTIERSYDTKLTNDLGYEAALTQQPAYDVAGEAD